MSAPQPAAVPPRSGEAAARGRVRPARILHLSTSDSAGGAARAAYRLHDGLVRSGWNSEMRVLRKSTADPRVHSHVPQARGGWRLQRLWRRHVSPPCFDPPGRPEQHGTDTFSDDRSPWPGEAFVAPAADQVLHLHWTTGLVDLPSFLDRHLGRTPLVWTLHDMRAFTGGCHYDYGCGRFRERCGACPQLGSTSLADQSRRSLDRLLHFRDRMRRGGFRVVADSEWLRREAAASALFRDVPVEAIHYGIELDVFQPIARAAAREALGLPTDAAVVMFAADGIHLRRKGLPMLLAALARLPRPPRILTVGGGHLALPPGLTGIHLGEIRSDRLLALAYSAADLFAIPSLQEAFGQTALEASACGTPVIGSNVGGIPDIVLPDLNGWLVDEHSAEAWAAALERILTDPATLAARRAAARKVAEDRFSLERQAADYARIYETCMNELRTSARADE